MSKLIEHATREMNSWESDDMTQAMKKDILELIEVFSKQGHSGLSASYCINVFTKLARYEPLSALTGNDDEWALVTDDLFQNTRDSRIFKEKTTGKSHFIDAIIFDDGNLFTGIRGGISSEQNINFPFYPKSFYVKVDGDKIIDTVELSKALEYYK